jgi:flagellar basal body-associated protein FliL
MIKTFLKVAKELKAKKKVFLFLIVGLFFVAGISSIYLQKKNNNEEITTVSNFSVRNDQPLIFDSFIIPFMEPDRFTYVSLSISFNVPNTEIKSEMIEKKHRIRGIIYDALRKEVNKTTEVPSLSKLKECILRVINKALPAGELNEVYLINFLTV